MPCASCIAYASMAEGDSDDDAAGGDGGFINGGLRWAAFVGALVTVTHADDSTFDC